MAPERIAWTVELLGVRAGDHLLEIGCGPGHAVALVCGRLSRGTITAIDRSAVMVARASALNAECIATGRARIEQGSFTEVELGRRFKTVFAVNVNAFWTAPAPSFEAVRTLLEPKGRVFLSYEPPSAARVRELERVLPASLEEAGFQVADLHVDTAGARRLICVVARRA